MLLIIDPDNACLNALILLLSRIGQIWIKNYVLLNVLTIILDSILQKCARLSVGYQQVTHGLICLLIHIGNCVSMFVLPIQHHCLAKLQPIPVFKPINALVKHGLKWS